MLEILPGALTWLTLLGAPILSYFHPAWVAIYIILFDLYWFLKGANVAIHLVHSYRELKIHSQVDWNDLLRRLGDKDRLAQYLQSQSRLAGKNKLNQLYAKLAAQLEKLPLDRNYDWARIYHLVILATYKESFEVLDDSIASVLNADYDPKKVIFVLASEERGGAEAASTVNVLEEKYRDKFHTFILSRHPDGLPGEAKVKSANLTYGAKLAQQFLDRQGVAYERVIVSGFDSDTIISKNYLAHLTYDFLTAAKPLQTSYQPTPMFHNNIWDTPAVARVIAVTSSFWQLIEASRPDRLITFSSHAMSFKTLVDVGFWRVDIIPDDSHIFWQCFLRFNGDYRTKPLYTTVSMDAVMGATLWETLAAQYKQKRRWAWGVTEIAMTFPELLPNRKIPLWKRLLYAERLLEGHYFWATASIMLAVLGWLPLILGGDRFGSTVLALNLPVMTKAIMSIATFFLAFSVYINWVLLPPRPKHYNGWKSFSMLWQWIFSPFVASIFGSLPAIDAQTRLMLGKYMETFWVTPKIRRSNLPPNPVSSEALTK